MSPLGRRRLRASERRASRLDRDSDELQELFSTIYREGVWTDAIPGMPRSGRGSLPEYSSGVRTWLEDAIAAGERSIADVGCGDLTWIEEIPSLIDGSIDYLGIDIVPELVAELRSRGWGRFLVGDLTASGFRVDADVVLCKDVLFHLTDSQIELALRNLAASRFRWLLLTSSDNPDNSQRTFDRWNFAPVNLERPPYDIEPAQRIERLEGGHVLVLSAAALQRWR
ncbi:methyltransferase domain-containing protein [Conexibacter sp. W3-3-2]|uniref:class I SAM-dependent methyltransferase n=1 Tax=Conexibacter sp. W3-3-2 TaxID=2675227 RepID=UPI0012B7B9A8|nr:class I SAM-dependent methyltransferase [Conexibacter sp. W3-3-2]MTD46237.1 methyltransferase domain-containing protein [Conexibacter sp. W3-3-2]